MIRPVPFLPPVSHHLGYGRLHAVAIVRRVSCTRFATRAALYQWPVTAPAVRRGAGLLRPRGYAWLLLSAAFPVSGMCPVQSVRHVPGLNQVAAPCFSRGRSASALRKNPRLSMRFSAGLQQRRLLRDRHISIRSLHDRAAIQMGPDTKPTPKPKAKSGGR
jgi:hypothetical protein